MILLVYLTPNHNLDYVTTDQNTDNFDKEIQQDINICKQFSGNEYIGKEFNNNFDDADKTKIFCIQACNPNGFRLNCDGGDFDEFCTDMNEYNIDMSCISEINLDTRNFEVKRITYNTAKKHFNQKVNLQMASSSIRSKSFYKPGGVMMLTTGNTSGRVVKCGSDKFGRWTYQYLTCKNNRCIVVITAYQPCRQSLIYNGRIRSNTVHAQQTSILLSEDDNRKPRKAFIDDLDKFIGELKAEGNQIILLGDFNEDLYEHNSGMKKLMINNNLCDLMWKSLKVDKFSTYIGGTKRIDYVLVDHDIYHCMLNACYEPFKYRNKGDHRTMVIDFDSDKLFGNPTYNIFTPLQREINSKDIDNVQKYCKARLEYLMDHNFDSRLQAVIGNWDKEKAESLDNDFQRACIHAASICKKKPNMAYIREISKLRAKKNVLQKLLSGHRLRRNFDRQIALSMMGTADFLIPQTVEEWHSELKEVQKKIKLLQNKAKMLRKNELEEAILSADLAGDKTTSTALRRKIKAEETKQMFQKIRNCRGRVAAGLTRIEAPTENGTFVTVTAPKEIEEKLRERNQKHFGQAAGTFPTIGSFSEQIDWGASTHHAELILNGEYNTCDVDDIAEEFIKVMKKKTDLDTISDLLTVDDWKGKMNSWKESTSTSPYGFHLSHSKILLANHGLKSDSKEAEELDKIRDTLIAWQVEMINLAIKNRYTFDRWRTVVNVMILKDPRDLRIHRLRVIHLYEQDYTMVLAIKWRHLLLHCDKHDLIHPHQFGAVPGKNSITPTIIEELQYEISRASKRPLVHNDYDATACYDRIIMNLASLISRSYGQHRSIVFINGNTLKQAKYVLKTKLGVSEEAYEHCELFPIYGSGQGAGNSPGI